MKIKKLTLRACTVTAVIMVLIAVLPVIQALAATSGPNNPGVGSNVAGVLTFVWNNPGNITTPDTPYATSNIGAGIFVNTDYLEGTQYGFAIPAGSTINGITIAINRRASGTSPNVSDNVVRLLKGGTLAGNNKAASAVWPTSFAPAAYGGSADLWGTTWTAADINAAGFGVALSAHKDISFTDARTATVDYMQITVDYTVPATTTSVDCGSGTPVVTYGSSLTCVATVTRSGGSNTPSGTVDWTTDGSGSFATSPCTLSGSGASATCSVSYTPSGVGSGSHLITATYSGDANFSGSTENQTVTVNRLPITVTADPQTKVYGDPDPALTYQVTGTLVGTDDFSGELTRDTGDDVGIYAITQGTLALSTNYDLSYIGADFTITQVTPTLSVDNSPVVYDGTPQAAVVASSELGTVDNILYDGSTTVPTDAGTYAVTADFTPEDTLNYTSLTDEPAGDFVILQRPIAVTADPQTKVYGDPDPELTYQVTGSLIGSDAFTGELARDPGEDVGTYDITQGTLALSTNYHLTYVGDFLTITQATPTLSVDNSPVVYNGTPQAAIVTGSVDGEVSNILYDGLDTIPTDAGTYAVTADFTPEDTLNYADLTDEPAGDFVISQRPITVTADPQTKIYGDPDPALTYAVTTGSLVGTDDFSGELARDTGEDVGSYAITQGTLALSANYSLTYVGDDLTITERPITVTADPQTKVYGDPDPELTYQVTTGTLAGTDDFSGALSRDAGEDVGTYAITQGSLALSANYTLTYVGDDLTITQATPTLSVTNSPVIYNGLAQAAVVTPSVAGIVSNVRYDGSTTVPTNTGTYAVTADFTPTDTLNYNSLTGASAGNFVITKATPTVSVTNSPVTYNGSPQAAVVLGSVPGAVSNIMYDGSATAPTNAGTYAVTADFTPTDTTNYNNLSGASAGNFVINPVTPTLSVTNSPVVFNGLPQAAVVTGSVAGTVSNVLYDASATVPTAVGTYAVTADFTPTDATNYTSLSGASAGNFVINPAGPGLTLTKTATPTVFGQAGKEISYTYLLTNTGDVTLAGPFIVTDDKLTVTCPVTAALAPAASITCTGSYTTTLADVLAGSVTNSATGSGSYATNPVVSNVAQTTVKAIRVFLSLLVN